MAHLAFSRKRAGKMIGIYHSDIGVMMTAIALNRRTGEAGLMAGYAGNSQVHAGKWETGCIVIDCFGRPVRRVMTLDTIAIETPLNVVGVFHGSISVLMAVVTVCRRARKTSGVT